MRRVFVWRRRALGVWLLWGCTMLLLLVMGRTQQALKGPERLHDDAGKYIASETVSSGCMCGQHITVLYQVFTLPVLLYRLGRVTPSWLRCEDILLIMEKSP
jgi:hypothetical protein